LAAKPPDETHAFGYSKAKYFSSAVEELLILVAAISIMVAAIDVIRIYVPEMIC
jgi:divalent metal cation (Fe/Co/Zn/Cd) transporter